MKPTTMTLPDRLDAELRREAARRGITLSALVREAIEAHLDRATGTRQLLGSGAGRSGQTDGVERIGSRRSSPRTPTSVEPITRMALPNRWIMPRVPVVA
jgi:post-segregation antitoxin (ccd killing protein)